MVTRPVSMVEDAVFWESAATRQLVVQRCANCAQLRHPPRPMCPACGSLEVEAQVCSGYGTILAAITSQHPNRPTDPATTIILVELDEGVRVVSNLIDPQEPPYEDRSVRVDFSEVDGATLPVFRLAGGSR